MNESKLPKSFWAKAAASTCYLISRSPSFALNFKGHEELWLGVPPSLDHLKTFRYIAYVHVNQGRLNLRAFKSTFLGYP